jgi:hypothetical protein
LRPRRGPSQIYPDAARLRGTGYEPATAATYAATALICFGTSVPPNAGMPPPPFVTCVTIAASLGFS